MIIAGALIVLILLLAEGPPMIIAGALIVLILLLAVYLLIEDS